MVAVLDPLSQIAHFKLDRKCLYLSTSDAVNCNKRRKLIGDGHIVVIVKKMVAVGNAYCYMDLILTATW